MEHYNLLAQPRPGFPNLSNAMPSSPLDLKTGVIEIGILISIFLYGIATVQTFIYFHDSARDPRWLKGMVRNVHSDIEIELTFPRWP